MTVPVPVADRLDVTVVLVTHDGARWLPRVLDALAAQTRAPDRILVADTGSRDATLGLVQAALPTARLVQLDRATGYGSAVRQALTQLPIEASPAPEGGSAGSAGSWIWLLHDDSEPEPDALQRLTEAVAADPGIAIAGPKIRGWYRRRMLLEVGVSIDGGGRRETGLERGEQDQGQHDKRRETLAVSSAGMLVRSEVWTALGGFDESLPLMRDDIDLCWRAWRAGHRVAVVPAAVVYHAEASAQSRRDVDISSGRVHLLDRAGALRVLLANTSRAGLVLALPRLLLGCLLRSLGYLVAKLPRHAADELLAAAAVLGRPRRIRDMRRDRASQAGSSRSLRRLFPPPGHSLAQARDALAAIAGGRRAEGAAIGRHRVRGADGAVSADPVDVGAGGVLIRRMLRSPGWLLVLGLVTIAVLGARNLVGGGRLLGGMLLPAPGEAGALWSAYADAWHPEGVGTSEGAPPYLAIVAALSTVLAGNPDLAVTLLLLGSVPLAAAMAYLAASALPTSRSLRVWAAAAYALLPVFGCAVATGRLGTAVAAALLPLLARAVVRAVGTPDRPGSQRAAWAGGLLAAAMTAFVPLAWVLVLVVVVAVLVAARLVLGWWDRGLANRLGILVAVPPLLLLPWSAQLVRQPSRLLAEPGAPEPDVAGVAPEAWRLLMLDPGGPGPVPGWVGVAVVVAGLAGLAIAPRRLVPALGWSVAVLGYGTALVVSRADVTPAAGGATTAAWPALALALAALGLLVAAMVGWHGLSTRLAAREFGFAQPTAAAIAALAVAGPAIGALGIVADGVDGPLRRADPLLVPAFVAAESATTDRPRTLVMRTRPTPGGERRDSLAYALVRGPGPRLGDAAGGQPEAAQRTLQRLVGDLVSGRGDAVADRLAEFAARYVLVRAPLPAALAESLDGVPGLERVSTQGGDGLWRVAFPVARVMFLPADPDADPVPLPSEAVRSRATIPSTPGGGTLVLAEPASSHWRADLDGRALPAAESDAWNQSFAVPADGGELRLRWDEPVRPVWLVAQVALLMVIVVLALPSIARGSADEEETPPAVPGRHARPDPVPADDGGGAP